MGVLTGAYRHEAAQTSIDEFNLTSFKNTNVGMVNFTAFLPPPRQRCFCFDDGLVLYLLLYKLTRSEVEQQRSPQIMFVALWP